jgi:hypothetical protein
MHQVRRIARPKIVHDYKYIFRLSTPDIKTNSSQNKRHCHWHLPDTLQDHNEYLTDRIHSISQKATAVSAAHLPSDCSMVNQFELEPRAQIQV